MSRQTALWLRKWGGCALKLWWRPWASGTTMHSLGRRSDARVRVYVNGIKVKDVASAGQNLEQISEPLTFGSYCGNGFIGAMDNVRVWSVARSEADIQRDMNWEYSAAVAANMPGLVGAWSFEGGTGVSAIDDSGHNPARTLVSGAAISLDPFLDRSCPSDVDGDGAVGGSDIALVLLDFGPCQ